jgi:hypothetical protein
MTKNEHGLRSMEDFNLVDSRMSPKMWEKRGLVPMGKMIMTEHTSLYRTDLSDDENAESMMRMFIYIPAEVITQRVLRIHEEFSNSFAPNTLRKPLKRKIVRWQHYMVFRNVSSFFRINVCKLRKSFRDW